MTFSMPLSTPLRSRLATASAVGILGLLILSGPAWANIDSDADGVLDPVDNCLLTPNGAAELSDQVDTDLDGYGNVCDADYNGDGLVTTGDYSGLLSQILQGEGELVGADLVYDHDGDGQITLGDLFYFEAAFDGFRTVGE